MRTVVRFCNASCLAAVVFFVLGGSATAQPYPSKPIRIVVPFPAGGGVDTTARLLGQKLGAAFNQQFVVDTRPGASGNIGTDIVAKSPPNGLTLLATFSSHATNAALLMNLPFDPVNDFAPISVVLTVPNILVVNPFLPVKTVKELIALAKRHPGKIMYASIGTGTPPHLSAELFNMMAGISMTHVPYKGGPPSMVAVISGEAQLAFQTVFIAMPHLKSDRLRAIAVATLKRIPMFPEVPTIDESGLPGYESSAWYAWLAPAKTPQPIIEQLHREIAKALQLPDVREAILSQGAEPGGGTPDQLGALIKADIEKWGRVVKMAKIKVD